MKIILEPSELTDENIDQLIRCAIHGIGYWALSGSYQPETRAYAVSYLADSDDPGTRVDALVTFEQFRTAFIALAAADELPKWQLEEIIFESLNFDSAVGDQVLQHALFGEQRFS